MDRLSDELRSRATGASASGCPFISGSIPCSGTVLRSAYTPAVMRRRAASGSAAATARDSERDWTARGAAAGVRGPGGPHHHTGAGTGIDRPLSAWQQEGRRRCPGTWRKRATLRAV